MSFLMIQISQTHTNTTHTTITTTITTHNSNLSQHSNYPPANFFPFLLNVCHSFSHCIARFSRCHVFLLPHSLKNTHTLHNTTTWPSHIHTSKLKHMHDRKLKHKLHLASLQTKASPFKTWKTQNCCTQHRQHMTNNIGKYTCMYEWDEWNVCMYVCVYACMYACM